MHACVSVRENVHACLSVSVSVCVCLCSCAAHGDSDSPDWQRVAAGRSHCAEEQRACRLCHARPVSSTLASGSRFGILSPQLWLCSHVTRLTTACTNAATLATSVPAYRLFISSLWDGKSQYRCPPIVRCGLDIMPHTASAPCSTSFPEPGRGSVSLQLSPF